MDGREVRRSQSKQLDTLAALTPDQQKELAEAEVSNGSVVRLYQAGQFADAAEPHFQRVMKIDEKALGPDHPGTATDLNNPAGMYYFYSQPKASK